MYYNRCVVYVHAPALTSCVSGGDVSDKKADEFTKKQNVLKKFEL